MIHQFFIDKRVHNSLTFSKYFEQMRLDSEVSDLSNLTVKEKEDLHMVKLNYQRVSRILRTYKMNEELLGLIKEISTPQIWMVISESWCGDSAQNLPYIAKIAESNPLINLRIILRDSNLDIMDLYLSDNMSRSIPKLVVFDEDGNELFQWGARPKEAQKLVTRLKNEGMEKEKFLEELHLWYGRDRGRTLESELKTLFEQSSKLLISK
ncbi:MAG: thioredoxin family protein [Ignavibacteriales bacterium]|nr:thioredoxin family protein [Ignavibacteriales bacterium]